MSPNTCCNDPAAHRRTGTVGQRFIVLLSAHPYFKLSVLGASPRSAGKPYEKSVNWKQAVPIPDAVKGLIVKECKAEEFKDCDVVFSGLDSDVAGDIGQYACWCASNIAH